jgi:hypothetical protein
MIKIQDTYIQEDEILSIKFSSYGKGICLRLCNGIKDK